MWKSIPLLILLFLICSLSGQVVSSEDESRFTARDYTKTEPGFLAPRAYIEIAKKALHARYKEIYFSEYEDPWIKLRFYKDAPSQDREMICVKFLHTQPTLPPKQFATRFPPAKGPVNPAILVLIRKDLSKVYINEIYLQSW